MIQPRLHHVFCFASAFLFFVSCEKEKQLHVRTEVIKVDSPEQIMLVTGSLVKPLLYTNISGLDKLPVKQAKAKFISAILPSVLVAKYAITQQRKTVETLFEKETWEPADSIFFLEIKSRYKANDIRDLMARMRTLPVSIVLAQAAVESGWGKSRIFLTANNLFGVWSYNSYEPRIAALRTREKKRTYLRSYPDMSQSVIHYFEILARSRSYKNLRKAQLETDDPFELLPHLKNYSERRSIYTNQLKRVILRNNLTQYDNYKIDPEYIVED